MMTEKQLNVSTFLVQYYHQGNITIGLICIHEKPQNNKTIEETDSYLVFIYYYYYY